MIEVEFDFDSYSLSFGSVSQNDSLTKSAFIQVKDPKKTKITDITTSSPLVTARQVKPPVLEGNKTKIEIEVTLLPGLPPGRLSETVTVHSNLKSKQVATLRLSGSIIGEVEVTPENLRFIIRDSVNPGDESTTQRLVILNRAEGTPLHILGVKDQNDRLRLVLRTVEEGQKYELTAALKQEAPSTGSNLSGSILITTDNPKQKEITVKYSAFFYGK